MRFREIIAEAQSSAIDDIALRGGYDVRQQEHERGVDFEFHPRGGTAYDHDPAHPGYRMSYHDPELSDLHHDAEWDRTSARAKSHLMTEITPLEGEGIIYRGMSHEAYEDFVRRGEVVSRGTHNFRGQEGLTYWTTDVEVAMHYANSFAPSAHKATFLHPAYVLATHRPAETRDVSGVGDHEVGVARPILKREIIAVWQGRAYDMPIIRADRRYDLYGDLKDAGGSFLAGALVWQRLL